MVKGRIMGNKIKRILVTLVMLFLTANWAMAGNNVELQTDVPDIPQSSCDQAGNIVMMFESGAQMQEGDIITFSLTNSVSVCKSVDFFLRLADQGTEQLQSSTSLPIYDTSTGSDYVYTRTSGGALYGYPMTDNGTMFDIGFRVYAPKNSQTITLTLGRRTSDGTFYGGNMPGSTDGKFIVTYTPDESDNRMVMRLFDQKNDSNFFFKDNVLVSGTQYTVAFTSTDDQLNALCINTSNLNITSQEYVLATPKSTVVDDSYRLSFTGDYYVAHVTSSYSYSIENACKDECPSIYITPGQDQWGNSLAPSGYFDTGNYNAGMTTSERWVSSGTCNSTS
jgi:hypothetical protein